MSSTTVTTLAERKSAEAARRTGSAEEAIRELREYALGHGGRFVVFGSYVTDTMRFDSDLDVMVDFPPTTAADAWLFVESVGARHAIPVDIHDAATAKASFTQRVLATGIVLG